MRPSKKAIEVSYVTVWNEAYIMLVSCIDYALDMTKAVNALTRGSLGLVSHGSESDMIFFPRLRVKIKKSMTDL